MRRFLLCGALALGGCADADPPSWADEAALSLNETTGTRLAFEWPEARDDRAVSGYLVRIDGEPAARLGPDAHAYAADELEEASEHEIEVLALDAAGNESSALRASVTTADETPPAFPPEAQLTLEVQRPEEPAAEGADHSEEEPEEAGERADDDGRRTVRLRWTAATDAVGVTSYRVLSGDEEVASVEAPETSVELEGVDASGALSYAVRAFDEAGNESEAGPSARWMPRAEAPDDRVESLMAETRAQVEQMLLGALSEDDGRLSDVLSAGAVTGNADDVLAQARGMGVASSPEVGGLRPRGGGGSGGGRIGGLGGLARADDTGGSTPPTERHPRGSATLGAVRRTSGTGDPAVITRLVRRRVRAMQRCYERQLRTDPDVAGTVTSRFEVVEAGTVRSAEIASNDASPAVGACVRNVVRRFRFDPAQPGVFEVPVTFAPRP